MKKVLFLIIGGLFLINSYGCIALLAGTAGGAGTAVWLSGKYVQDVNSSYDKTVDASNSALKTMNLEITKENRSSQVTQIRSRYMDGRKIWIDVKPLTLNSSRIEVRVGALSDKVASETLLKKIISFL